ncbi:MAG: phosphatase [Candidatus Sericytochromatia bacterium]|nr:phosphatase [Candidatus Tanganyikabacteria bacterium]
MSSSPTPRPATKACALEQLLLRAGFAGTVPNSRAANLRAIERLLAGEPFYTFGIRRIEKALAEGMLDQEGAIRVMARACGCRDADQFLGEQGYIGPKAAAAGLLEMSRWLAEAAEKRWTVALGTGHPGSMLGCYIHLAEWLRDRGCDIAPVPVAHPAGVDWWADELGGVAITSDGCGILHGHGVRVMESVLDRTEVDIVIADHGFAGAAVNARVACLAVMDTNDPALGIAHALGCPELLVVPLYDNLPNGTTRQLAAWLISLAEDRLKLD